MVESAVPQEGSNVVIAEVIGLRRDPEQPDLFELNVRLAEAGSPPQTFYYDTEEHLRTILRDGGIAGIEIDALFYNVA